MHQILKNHTIKLSFLLLLFAAGATAQAQYSLRVLFGKKTVYSTVALKADVAAACSISAKARKTAFSKVTVRFVMQENMAVYKNTLQLVCTAADGSEKSMDAPLTKGVAVFNAADFKKMLTAYKSITLRLVQDPANPRMSMPSRMRTLLLINTN
jgi:hypothetical protein